MREQWARRIALLTGVLVLVLAVIFAYIQNPSKNAMAKQQVSGPEFVGAAVLNAQDIEAGREVYKQMGCARCHSIAGEGNPRNPLDNTGARHSADELRAYIIGADIVRGAIPEYAIEFKQSYRELSDDDFSALVIYMQSLRP